ncbi:MAG: MATE family efflux transporter [Clostridiales Family XIII bacterium]|nr:MATE family efflux transporter [Clostridiales Family XIII bacterium]
MADSTNNPSIGTENKMGVMPIRRLIISMSFPAMISMIVAALYNIVESIFVASISEAAMAAITLVFPVQMMQVSFAVGTGVGLNSLISRRLGEKRQKEADSAASHGFVIALINWAIFAAFGIFFAKGFIGLFTNDPFILENATVYCRIVVIGSLFQFVSVCCERILQATGNMLFPMIFNLTGAVLNIVLSPILILGLFGFPKLGVMGAGLACISCQFVAMVIALILVFRFKHHVHIRFRGFRVHGDTLRDIYAVGVPSIVMLSIGSIMIAGLNAILIGYSAAAVAVLGVYFRLNSFIFMPVFGLNQGSLPVMGYNYGAKNRQRLISAYKTAVTIAVTIMAIGTAIFWIFPRQLMMLFSATPEMMEIGLPALRIISLCFVSAAFSIVTSGMFQALAHGLLSMLVSLLRQLILVVPLTYLLLRYMGIAFSWASFPLAEFLSLILTVCFLRYIYKKEIKSL